MPASSRLLQQLNKTWGEEVTQDLVTWVNEGKTVNRAELQELADLYFARFGDRLEERVALSEARFDTKLAALEGRLDARMAGLEGRLEARMAGLEGRMDTRIADLQGRLDTSIADLEGRLEAGLAGVDGRLQAGLAGVDGRLAALRADIASQMRDQMKWMFAFWIGTLVPLAGLMVALGKDWL